MTTPGDGLGTGSGLKRALRRASRMQRVRDLALVAPLLAYITVFFAIPIVLFLARSVDNTLVPDTLPRTVAALGLWDGVGQPPEQVLGALAADLDAARAVEGRIGKLARRLNEGWVGYRTLVMKAGAKLPPALDTTRPDATWADAFRAIDKRWLDPEPWTVLRAESGWLTPSYLLQALDLKWIPDHGVAPVEAERALYRTLLARTFAISAEVTALCLLLGFPVAFVLSHLPSRRANVLMICVMLPFWTSLLVRTTAWVILLQRGGPVNTALVWLGLTDEPLELIFNRFGALVAMVHVLLPFVVLPVYAVMKQIAPTQMRAAISLGARPRVAFLRVYLPQTFPGIAAGTVLVFILALGYYITPALTGGPREQMISSMIAYHMNEVINWGLASALGTVLLLATALTVGVLGRTAVRRA